MIPRGVPKAPYRCVALRVVGVLEIIKGLRTTVLSGTEPSINCYGSVCLVTGDSLSLQLKKKTFQVEIPISQSNRAREFVQL